MTNMPSLSVSWDVARKSPEGPSRLHASLRICGAPLHVTAFRVTTQDRMQVVWDQDDASDLDALYALYEDDIYQPVSLPGFPGSWLIYAVPYK